MRDSISRRSGIEADLHILAVRLSLLDSTSGSRRRLERSTPGDGRHLYRLAARGSQPYDCRKSWQRIRVLPPVAGGSEN
jgi:hypothetical protein